MRTSQLEYFIAVADTLSFTKAAERCHVAQPAISQQIQALEKELGFALFSRSTKGVELTAAGRQYCRDVADVLDALRRADQHAAAIAHGQAGSISIGVASSGQLSTFRVIDRFRGAYPEISINLRRALSRIQEEQLRSGAYDVAPAPPCAFTDQEGLAFAHASREPLSIIMSEAHPLATKSDLTVSDLLPYPPYRRRRARRRAGEGHLSPPRRPPRSDSAAGRGPGHRLDDDDAGPRHRGGARQRDRLT